MLRVVIADDEIRICRLIQALVPWEDLGMEIVSLSHDGIQALEDVNTYHPDILITDIRMPGCSGLELIEKVKMGNPYCEIIIISGYTHFEYARTAIRYGVGDYLLKPVNKEELLTILRKLKERILIRKEGRQLLNQVQQDSRKGFQELVQKAINHWKIDSTRENLIREYGLYFDKEIFFIFVIKICGDYQQLNEEAVGAIMERVSNSLDNSLPKEKQAMFSCQIRNSLLIVVNTSRNEQEAVLKRIKSSISQLDMIKSMYRNVEFLTTIGEKQESTEGMIKEIPQVLEKLKEKLMCMVQREKRGIRSDWSKESLLKNYTKQIGVSLELFSIETMEKAVDEIQQWISQDPAPEGKDVWDTIQKCARIFLYQAGDSSYQQEGKIFDDRCEYCHDALGLLRELRRMQENKLRQLQEKKEEENSRPIRLAKEYIQNRFKEQITMDEVASHVGLSSSYFSVLFKKTEGQGFLEYLINLRIEEAKRRLRETNEPIAVVCKEVGYNDVKHFVATFSKSTGLKPSVYRNLYG